MLSSLLAQEMSMDGHLQQSLTQYRPQDYCTSLQTDTGNAPEALTLEGGPLSRISWKLFEHIWTSWVYHSGISKDIKRGSAFFRVLSAVFGVLNVQLNWLIQDLDWLNKGGDHVVLDSIMRT